MTPNPTTKVSLRLVGTVLTEKRHNLDTYKSVSNMASPSESHKSYKIQSHPPAVAKPPVEFEPAVAEPQVVTKVTCQTKRLPTTDYTIEPRPYIDGYPVQHVNAVKIARPVGGDTVTILFQDFSGSQHPAVEDIIKLHRALLGSPNTFVVPFGDDNKRNYEMLTSHHIIRKCSNPNFTFPWSTNPKFIEMGLNNEVVNKPNNKVRLVIQGDGAFDGGNDEFIGIINRLSQLRNIVSLTIVYSSHTEHSVQESLTNAFIRICSSNVNLIPVSVNILRNDTIPRIVESLNTVNVVWLPSKYIQVNDLALEADVPTTGLIKFFSDPENESWLHGIFTFYRTILTCTPNILKDAPIIYAKLHSVFKAVYGREYLNWFSTLKGKASPETKLVLDIMLGDVVVSTPSKVVQSNISGYVLFKGTEAYSTIKAEIQDILKNHDIPRLIIFVRKLFKTADTRITPPGGRIVGFPILNDTATREDCQHAMGQLFHQYGDFSLSGIMLYVTCLTILFTEVDIIPAVYKQLERAIFDDLDTTLRFIGFNPATNEWNIDIQNKLLIPCVCELLAKGFRFLGQRFFPGVPLSSVTSEGIDPVPSPDTNTAISLVYATTIKFHRCYTVARFVNSYIRDYPRTRRVFQTYQFTPIGAHMICLLKPFPKDPQRNLPSLTITGAIYRTQAFAEYFDRPMGTNDTVLLGKQQYIPLIDLSHVSTVTRMKIVEDFNNYMVFFQEQGTAGFLTTDFDADSVPNKAMCRGAELEQSLLDSNISLCMTKLVSICERHGIKPKLYSGFVDEQIPLSRAEVVDILNSLRYINNEFALTLKTGNNLNRSSIIASLKTNFSETRNIPKSSRFEHIQAQFIEFMKQKPPAIINATDIFACQTCLDVLPGDDMTKHSCTHVMCNGCHHSILDYTRNIPPGTQIQLAYCRCAGCMQFTVDLGNDPLHQFLVANADAITAGKIPVRCERPTCESPYYLEELACGTDTLSLDQRLCLRHRPVPVKQGTVCPGCGVMHSKISGCDCITCGNHPVCRVKFCYGCGIQLPSHVYDWHCYGSQANCEEQIDQHDD